METRNIGLRGVTVADSRVSFIDGNAGVLLYRGYHIRDLARESTFEEVVHLLLMGRLPTTPEAEATRAALAEARELPGAAIACLKTRRLRAHPMDVLQGAIAVLADHDPDVDGTSRDAMVRASLRLIARTGSLVAAWHRLSQGKDPVHFSSLPDAGRSLSHGAAFLYALWGHLPTADETRLVDLLMVLHAEHTFNASTFAAREVASTRAHLYASVGAAVGALSGPLHGGANARVMEMLLEIGAPGKAKDWCWNRVRAGERVMGLGHAVHASEDPRAVILREVAERVLAGRPEEVYFRVSLEVESEARAALRELKGLDLHPNVDFYSGSILYALGLKMDHFPAFFAVSRVAGWCAHVIEETFAEAQPKPALYRPEANYTGRMCGPQGCQYVPIEQRGAGCPCGKDLLGCNEEQALRTP